MSDGFEENVEFFTMTYEDPRTVAHNRAFDSIAPLLWLKAGAQGRRIDKATDDFDIADTYGVLFDMDTSGDFLLTRWSGSSGPTSSFTSAASTNVDSWPPRSTP